MVSHSVGMGALAGLGAVPGVPARAWRPRPFGHGRKGSRGSFKNYYFIPFSRHRDTGVLISVWLVRSALPQILSPGWMSKTQIKSLMVR